MRRLLFCIFFMMLGVIGSISGHVFINKKPMTNSVTTQSNLILTELKDKDYRTLKDIIHPVKGLRFSPYSFIDVQNDVTVTKENFLTFMVQPTPIVWGSYDGSGEPIELTPSEYFEKFVYSGDFVNAGIVNLDKLVGVGNSIENYKDVYPNSRFVEFYIIGTEKYSGMDWQSLRLFFEMYQNNWVLVGIVHSQWTI